MTYFLLGVLVGFLIAIAAMWWLLWLLGGEMVGATIKN